MAIIKPFYSISISQSDRDENNSLCFDSRVLTWYVAQYKRWCLLCVYYIFRPVDSRVYGRVKVDLSIWKCQFETNKKPVLGPGHTESVFRPPKNESSSMGLFRWIFACGGKRWQPFVDCSNNQQSRPSDWFLGNHNGRG